MKNKILYLLLLEIGSLNLKAQRYVTTPLSEHKSFFAGLVEKRKGNCDIANYFFNEEKSDKSTMNHDHWKDKAESQMVVCSNLRTLSVPARPIARVKIKKPRIISKESKSSILAGKSASKVENKTLFEKKTIPEQKTKSHPVANAKPHYRVKLEESSIPDKTFISLADLGPVYSVEENGRFAYFIASSNKEEKAYDLALKVSDRTNNKPSIEQCIQGNVVKSFTIDQFSLLPEVKSHIIETEKKKEPVKTEEIRAKASDNSESVIQPYVVIESLSESNKADMLKAKLDKLEYITVSEKHGIYTRVGVIPKENQSLDALLEELRKNVNAKAWIRR